jgi:hypothetical protein
LIEDCNNALIDYRIISVTPIQIKATDSGSFLRYLGLIRGDYGTLE